MAKRYADTKLHKKRWFRELPWMLRESWRILCAECDEIGIWELDLEALNFSLNIPDGSADRVTLEQLVTTFELVRVDDDKLWIPGFVAFQYGDEAGVVSMKNKLTPKIIRMLRARNLPLPEFKDVEKAKAIPPPPASNSNLSPIDPPSNTNRSPMDGVKVIVQVQDKEEDQVQPEGSGEGAPRPAGAAAAHANRFKFDFEGLFSLYPRFQKRTASLALLAENIHDQPTYDNVAKAMKRYAEACERDGVEFSKILTFPNWWPEWRDWLDPRAGTSPAEAKAGASGSRDLSHLGLEKPGGAK